MKAADHWETEAHRWVAWARAAGHGAYWYYHRKIIARSPISTAISPGMLGSNGDPT